MANVKTHPVTCARCARVLSLISLEGEPQFFALEEVGAFYALVGTGDGGTGVFFACSVDCAELVQARPGDYMKPEPPSAGTPTPGEGGVLL